MQEVENTTKEAAIDGNNMLCAVCKSDVNVKFIKISDCNLCEKCQKELADSFEYAMCMDRSDYPEL